MEGRRLEACVGDRASCRCESLALDRAEPRIVRAGEVRPQPDELDSRRGCERRGNLAGIDGLDAAALQAGLDLEVDPEQVSAWRRLTDEPLGAGAIGRDDV